MNPDKPDSKRTESRLHIQRIRKKIEDLEKRLDELRVTSDDNLPDSDETRALWTLIEAVHKTISELENSLASIDAHIKSVEDQI